MKKQLVSKIFTVEFKDADPQGILYFSRLFDWAHSCLEQFWILQPQGWSFWFQNPEFAIPLRHAEADYLAPLKAGQQYRAEFEIANVGQTSIEFCCEIWDDQKLCGRVKTVHVFVDKKTFEKCAVPQSVRLAFN